MSQILSEIKDFKKEFDLEIDSYLKSLRKLIDSDILYSSIDYALVSSAKRLRPYLIYQIYKLKPIKSKEEDIKKFALSLELIHNYTLIHDDMPCIDNDELRHNKLTLHKKYGEGVAMLCGDALLAEGTRILSLASNKKETYLAKKCFLDYIGIKLIDGQVQDFRNESLNLKNLIQIYYLKTSTLFTAAIKATAILLKFSKKEIKSLEEYAKSIGILFQIVDDIIGKNQNKETTGKTENSLSEKKRTTIFDFIDEKELNALIDQYVYNAKNAIKDIKNSEKLYDLITYLVDRTK